MNNILGSKIKLEAYDNYLAIEFNDCISNLLDLEIVQKLDDYAQHVSTSRLQHSINVAYYSYLMCKILHFDYRSAARAGVLHDLFLYDWHDKYQTAGMHAFEHPKIALENAKAVTSVNEIEADAIAKHMWPLCASAPRYKESVIVSLADKYCATAEIIDSFFKHTKNKFKRKVAYEN